MNASSDACEELFFIHISHFHPEVAEEKALEALRAIAARHKPVTCFVGLSTASRYALADMEEALSRLINADTMQEARVLWQQYTDAIFAFSKAQALYFTYRHLYIKQIGDEMLLRKRVCNFCTKRKKRHKLPLIK
jgi:hypothetical protein